MSSPSQTEIIRRRKSKRYGQGGAVTVRRGRTTRPITGSLFDLSTGGCLIWADWFCDFHSTELIEIKLQSGDLTFRVMGSVRHTSEKGRLLGIEFERLSPKDALDLELLITRLQAAADRENALAAF